MAQETTAAPNTAAAAYPVADAAATGTAGPPTKSALKRMEKEAALAAKKALKKASQVAAPVAGAPKEAKKREVKKAAVVEEPAFIEVPEGQIKGQCSRS